MAASMFGPSQSNNPVGDVLRWLQQSNEDWLLVFDNAPVSGLTRYLPDGDCGNVLYTSRHRNLQPRLRPECVADVEEMDIQDAVLLLLRSAQQMDHTDENREFAKDIVRALGLLPLAIDQAGAYIHMAPCPLGKYLGIFNEQKETLLRNPRFKGGDEQRHIAVYATFNISHKAIKAFAEKREDMARAKDAETALKLLNLFCFYNNEGYIHTIFDQAAKIRYEKQRHLDFPIKAGDVELGDLLEGFRKNVTHETPDGIEWDSDDYASGISFLHEFSLIKVDFSTAYSNMHILIHDWARNRMGKRERSEWGSAARAILLDSVSFKKHPRYVAYRRDVTPHVELCQRYVTVEHDDPLLESEYLGKVAEIFQAANRLEAAEFALEKALKYRQAAFGFLHRATFSAMSQLADIYSEQGRYAKAEELLRELLDRRRIHQQDQKWESIYEAQKAASKNNHNCKPIVLDADDPLDDPRFMNNTKSLSSVLISLDQKEAAAEVCLKIQRWYEHNDASSPKVRIYRDFVSRLRSEIDEANGLSIHEASQRLTDSEARHGRVHPETICHMKALADILVREEGYPEAQKLYLEVYEFQQRLYGETSNEAFDAMRNIAHTLWLQKRVFEADDLYHALQTHWVAVLGNLHPKTLRAKFDMALCLYAKTMYIRAERLMGECLEGRRTVLGPDHTLTRQSEHLLRQIRETRATGTDYFRAGLRNSAIQTSIDALGDRAPEWMRRWEPESVEDLMRGHLARGTLRKTRLEVTREWEWLFTQILPLDEADQLVTPLYL